MEIHKAQSRAELNAITADHFLRACKVPDAYEPLVREIIGIHTTALGISLGCFELCYQRTKAHPDATNTKLGIKGSPDPRGDLLKEMEYVINAYTDGAGDDVTDVLAKYEKFKEGK